ncbi:MAG: zf-HC2 domain-containing protein [Polyangiaceae bacterium]
MNAAIPSTCRATVGAMTDLLERTLGAGDLALAEAHLAACPRCREVLDALRALPAAIARLTSAPEPAGLSARVLAAIESGGDGRGSPSRR